MAPEFAPQNYKDLLVFLATAGVVVPLFNRFKISPVLGFLTAGVLLGPDGLGRLAASAPWVGLFTIGDAKEIEMLAEFGVVFLLFMIGLELSWERLRAMRRLVFGLGAAQVGICAALIGGAALALGQPPVAAAVLGLGLALSTTAVVMPVLAETGRLKSGAGRTAFAVLLAQDLAVAPILVMVTLLAGANGGGADWTKALMSLLPAAAMVAALVLGGRLLLRPLFHMVARAHSPELFVALSLLVVIGAGVAAAMAGLSMALGAFIAGLLLAETEFRREVEVTIEPFKGLLLGMFFVSVGVGLDVDGLIAQPLTVLAIALGVVAIKTLAVMGLGKLFRLPDRSALEAGLVLGPAGEFAFVVIGTAVAGKVIDQSLGQLVLVAVTLSLFLVPLLAFLGQRASRQMKRPGEGMPAELADVDEPAGQRVLVVGYGRVGRLVGEMLARHDIPFVAVDSDPILVSRTRDAGQAIYFGDAGREEFLKRCGIETTPAAVVTMDAPGKVDEVVRVVRKLRPDLTLVARARDDRHAAKLYKLGVTDAVPETVEASLQLAENTLVDLGVPMGLVIASIHEKRDEFRKLFQAASADRRPVRAMRRARGPVDLF